MLHVDTRINRACVREHC